MTTSLRLLAEELSAGPKRLARTASPSCDTGVNSGCAEIESTYLSALPLSPVSTQIVVLVVTPVLASVTVMSLQGLGNKVLSALTDK